MLIRGCQVDGAHCDVRVDPAAGRIAEIARRLAALAAEHVIEASGGALLPGLNDHHAHLFATAAALGSVRCGPPHVRDAPALAAAISAARAGDGGWLRGVGYHEAVAGALDRLALDRIEDARPVRVQHRTGALWVLNSAAIAMLGLDAGVDAPGVERDAVGRATGRLFRLDAWLRARIAESAPSASSSPRKALEPALRALSQHYARCGVTGVTDAGADNGASALAAIADAQRAGDLAQRVLVMGDESLPVLATPELSTGALKLLLDERALPDLGSLVARIAAAHARRRTVAVHCVTRVELHFALAALAEARVLRGDRIEHASVAPPEAVREIARLGLTVVTQPSGVLERGDTYLDDVDPTDRAWLYRARVFLAQRTPLAAGSDAPYAEPDPWRAMRAACERRTAGGAALGSAEALTPEEALALFTAPLEAPGSAPPPLAPGAPADLCLLRVPWSEARRNLHADLVTGTWRAGHLLWNEDAPRP